MYEPPTSDSTVVLSASLTIRSVAEARASILEALGSSDSVSLVVDDGCEVDVSGVQVIAAARKYARDISKTLRLSAPASGRLLETMQRGGFLEQMDEEDRQFWLQTGAMQ